MSIGFSVGEGGANRPEDVAEVSGLLNLRAAWLDIGPVPLPPVVSRDMLRAIRNFRLRIEGDRRALPRIDAHSPAARLLSQVRPEQLRAEREKGEAAIERLSGERWWRANQAKFPNSTDLATLDPVFRTRVEAFLGALRRAGAEIVMSTTRRDASRAYLMHYSFRIGRQGLAPHEVPPRQGVDILWDHGEIGRSRAAAARMAELFGIVFKPALTSNHIRGTAIDVSIRWSDTIEVEDSGGRRHRLDTPRNGADNTALHRIGASYGVKKLVSDRPHWSIDGR